MASLLIKLYLPCVRGGEFNRKFQSNLQVVEKILDEIVETERTFYRKLDAFVNTYGAVVLDSAAGIYGEPKRKHLMLDKAEADLLVGRNIKTILVFSRNLLEKLLNVRSEINDEVPEAKLRMKYKLAAKRGNRVNRLALFVEIFLDSLNDMMEAYLPYIMSFKRCNEMLMKKTSEVQKLNKKNIKNKKKTLKNFTNLSVRASSRKELAEFNFLKLWNTLISEDDDSVLYRTNIESVLIAPVQRIFQTKMLFERLLKKTGKNQPVFKDLQQLTKNIDDVATDLDKNVAI